MPATTEKPEDRPERASPASRWVINSAVDLSCVSVGWVVFYFAPVLFPEYFEAIRIFSISFLFATHRYFTFLLVYLDRVEFDRHRKAYAVIPPACLLFVVLCYYFRIDEPEMYALWYLFNYFHFVRQKYGFLRIYSGKARWGHKRLDQWTIYACRAAKQHSTFLASGEKTCIDCHKGIAHELPDMTGVPGW